MCFDTRPRALFCRVGWLPSLYGLRFVFAESKLKRNTNSDIGERSRLLGQLSQQMKRLSDRHGAAFVVVNQVRFNFGRISFRFSGFQFSGRSECLWIGTVHK